MVQAPDAEAIPAFDDALRDIVGTSRVLKIGEGTFKEVYCCQDEVVTTMPIDGDMLVNDVQQQAAGEVLGELLVLGALSSLSHGSLSCGAISGVFWVRRVAGWCTLAFSHAYSSEPIDLRHSQMCDWHVPRLHGRAVDRFRLKCGLFCVATLNTACVWASGRCKGEL
jgi:hypothetical protein